MFLKLVYAAVSQSFEVAVEIETHYALKLFFSNPAFVQIYFEAVANAIDANANRIEISIRTDGKIHKPGFVEITIRDNGVGFTDERYERFKRLKEPQDAYHKGLGRLVYLQYFSEVAVKSVHDGKRRAFTFAHNFDGSCIETKAQPSEAAGTELKFAGFCGNRIKSYDDLKPSTIKQKLLEQFLPVLYDRKRDGNPVEIDIVLATDENNPQKEFFPDREVLSAKDLPVLKSSTIKDKTIDGFSSIEVSYAIQCNQSKPLILTAASIDGRTIPLKLLPPASVPIGASLIFLFASDLFTGNSDSARQRLVLPDGTQEGAVFRALKEEIGRILVDEIPEIQSSNADMKVKFENKYPHLIGLFDAETVGLLDRDEVIETAQKRFFQQQRQVIESDPSDDVAFQKSLEISARSLTEYILYRDWVIKRLQKTTTADREEVIHNLLVPRYDRFDDATLVEGLYRNNAWVLDDKFMTFRTILSEATMNDVIAAIAVDEDVVEDQGRPDISMIFSADPEKVDHVDVVVVELKRRTNDDKENTYAYAQLVKRARKLVDYCPNIQRVWYYGVIEIDDALAELLRDDGWIPLHSKGHVYYKERSLTRKSTGLAVPIPFFLLSFEAITADAAARNHTFLELLKSKFKRQDSERNKREHLTNE